MSHMIVLPTPLSAESLRLGQLITDPANVTLASFTPSSQPKYHTSKPELRYQTTVAHDDFGRFLHTTSRISRLPDDNLLLLNAEASSVSSVADSRAALDLLRRDSSAHAFLRKVALQRQPLYYVAGVQKLKNPTFQRSGIAEATSKPIRLPTHVKRHDSATSLGRADSTQQNDDEYVFAVELIKVKCYVGDASEPHTIDDIDYRWNYYNLEDGSQLSVGIGGVLKSTELREFTGIVADEDYTDDSWNSYNSEDDDGIGGF